MKDFNQIKFQDELIVKFKTVHKSYRFRTSRAGVRKLVKLGYTLNQAINLVNDAFDIANLEK